VKSLRGNNWLKLRTAATGKLKIEVQPPRQSLQKDFVKMATPPKHLATKLL
jgi:hypothetical protein